MKLPTKRLRGIGRFWHSLSDGLRSVNLKVRGLALRTIPCKWKRSPDCGEMVACFVQAFLLLFPIVHLRNRHKMYGAYARSYRLFAHVYPQAKTLTSLVIGAGTPLLPSTLSSPLAPALLLSPPPPPPTHQRGTPKAPKPQSKHPTLKTPFSLPRRPAPPPTVVDRWEGAEVWHAAEAG